MLLLLLRIQKCTSSLLIRRGSRERKLGRLAAVHRLELLRLMLLLLQRILLQISGQ